MNTLTGKHAKAYDDIMFSNIKKRQPNRFLNRNVDAKKQGVFADFCCGSGVSIAYLHDRCSKVYGIDGSKDMIDMCKKRFSEKKIELHVCNVTNTPIPSNSCDYVLIRMGIHHIREKQAVINEAYRVLKKGGKLLVMDLFSRYGIFTYIGDFFENIKRKAPLFGHIFCSYNKFKVLTKKFTLVSEYVHPRDWYIKANVVLEK